MAARTPPKEPAECYARLDGSPSGRLLCVMHRLVLLVLLSAAVSAAGQPAAVDPRTVGPQVGAKVPSFALPDQTGRERTLDSLMRPRGVVLVFFRSADW
jgi:cytochrome oxidase Cu insertion factor (SCO1/SenC/PrrC family)